MTARSPIVLVALDACDPGVARRLAREGRMPTVARLFERAARCKVRNPHGLFVGALWSTFATGLRADRHGFHCWDQIDVPTYDRRLTPRPQSTHPRFWETLSQAGRRVAIVDVPHMKADVPLNGVEVVEWGCHDRHFGFHTLPPERAADIHTTFGLHPLLGMDAYSDREFAPDDYAHRAGPLRTLDEELVLLGGLSRGVAAKQELNASIMADDRWDLFVTVHGESHAVGHQLWHLHDDSHPRFNAEHQRAIGGDPIARLYSELDDAVAKTIAQAGPDATVLVLLSHGMGPHYDGTHLLDEVLGRLDRFNRAPSNGSGAKEMLKRVARGLPGSIQSRAYAFAVPFIRRRIEGVAFPPCREFATADDRSRQRYYLEPNNFVYGGVRLNLAGREPNGCVRPDEVDAVVKQLRDDLMALVNVDTGGPVVRGLERSDRWYRRSPTDTMPDLFIEWERTALIETVWSPKIGVVHAPYEHWRSGDHLPDGLLFAYGPGIPSGKVLPTLDNVDLAPSLAARLGVTLDDIDGSPVPWLAESR